MLEISVIMYLDNILVYSSGYLAEHRALVHKVLHCLHKHKLFAKVEKCAFHKKTVEYLSYILMPNGLMMDPTKVDTITSWPTPCKVKDLRSFLGFANFHCHFIWNYSDICIPLTRLTHKTAMELEHCL